jgi:hypothetical protein
LQFLFALTAVLALGLALGAPPIAAQAPAGKPAERYLQTLGVPPSHREATPLDPAEERVAKEVAARFGAQLLRAERGDEDGRAVYRVVIMAPGGNLDNAYAVRTLVVDEQTGALIPQFRNEPSGYALSAPADRTPRDDGIATTLRRESFGKP